MKSKISIFFLGAFLMFLSFSPVSQASDLSDAASVVAAVVSVYKVIDGNCDDKRQEDDLKDRCKNMMCGPVACISFRPSCENRGGPC